VKTEVQRNYLEIDSLKNLFPAIKPNDFCKIQLVHPPDFQLNKFFYKQIGKNYRWLDRLSWSDKKWINYVSSSNINTYILKYKNELAGYFEQIIHTEDNNCEIAYLGILQEYIGSKYGGFLLTEAIRKSFLKNINRVWVHTCSLDHKNALANYLARGMKIYKSEKIILNLN
tara:strand:- start:911 stop:1423 length:513 start_codon:yes stop_codon:yes gene_type:complete